MQKKEYFYPIWLRFWHWFNAILFCCLIATGLSMHYSSADFTLIRFDLAVIIHNYCGIALSASYLIFVTSNLITGNGKQYMPQKKMLKNSMIQAKYYLSGIFKKQPHPFSINKEKKFNPLQRITYLNVMYLLLPFFIITGWGLLYPEFIWNDIANVRGLIIFDWLHIVFGFILSIFMIGHIYMATISKKPLSNFKAMVNGWHITDEEE
jgi:thiosulfate reductase cytochrome b subunit